MTLKDGSNNTIDTANQAGAWFAGSTTGRSTMSRMDVNASGGIDLASRSEGDERSLRQVVGCDRVRERARARLRRRLTSEAQLSHNRGREAMKQLGEGNV